MGKVPSPAFVIGFVLAHDILSRSCVLPRAAMATSVQFISEDSMMGDQGHVFKSNDMIHVCLLILVGEEALTARSQTEQHGSLSQ